MGCDEQLIIDSTVHKHATSKNRNLHRTYIDYQKAFHSVPHSWLIQIIEIYNINSKIIDFLRNIMPHSGKPHSNLTITTIVLQRDKFLSRKEYTKVISASH